MKIVNCALLYADGDKYVWSVVTEDADEFPIDMDLVADGSVWENDGVKSVLTDGEWVAEGSGGGMSFPIFTSAGASLTCDMTYEEAKAVFDAEALGGIAKLCPCKTNLSGSLFWGEMEYKTKDRLEELLEGLTFEPALPTTLGGGLYVEGTLLFGSDGIVYKPIVLIG